MTNPPNKKFCPKCKTSHEPAAEAFWKNARSHDGLQTYCKSCLRGYGPRATARSNYEGQYKRISKDGVRERIPRVTEAAEVEVAATDSPTPERGDPDGNVTE